MTAARKLTAEQRAACVWARPKLRLVKLTPAEPEIVSARVQNIVVAIVWIASLLIFGAHLAGWL
jgi:hypothetical protein